MDYGRVRWQKPLAQCGELGCDKAELDFPSQVDPLLALLELMGYPRDYFEATTLVLLTILSPKFNWMWNSFL